MKHPGGQLKVAIKAQSSQYNARAGEQDSKGQALVGLLLMILNRIAYAELEHHNCKGHSLIQLLLGHILEDLWNMPRKSYIPYFWVAVGLK